MNSEDYDEQIEEINNTLEIIQSSLDSIQLDSEVLNQLSIINDPEDRLEITTDSEYKTLRYRDKNGINHETVGFDSPKYYQNGRELDIMTPESIANYVTIKK